MHDGKSCRSVNRARHAFVLRLPYVEGMHTTTNDLSIIGRTNARVPFQRFGVRQADRLQHVYLIGKTGTGKSTLIESLALQDIVHRRGIMVLDPHGDLADRLVQALPAREHHRVRYLDAADLSQPFGYNPLRGVAKPWVSLAASGLLEAFLMLWPDAHGVRMEHILRQSLYALIEAGNATLADIARLLTDPGYRASVLRRVTNPEVLAFWRSEYPRYNPRYRQEAIAPIQNKVGALLADPHLYRVLVTPTVDLHFREIMDQGGILIVNLAKGRLGPDSSRLLGALLVTTVTLAALTRSCAPTGRCRPFHVYVDEFQSFTTLSVVSMVSELRKFGVALTLAHQHLAQLRPEVRDAVLGNVGTVIAFRLGPQDAELLAKEFHPTFARGDLMNLRNHDIYLRLMIDGQPSTPFSATTLSPAESRAAPAPACLSTD